MKNTAASITEGSDLTGKTAVVTGATSGLGKEVARVMALRGARVVIPARNVAKGQAVAAELGGRCEVRACDLSTLRVGTGSVASFARTLAAEKIDYLFLNAGVFGAPFRLTSEGYEHTYASNYLGHFLLVHRLLASSVFADDARIVATFSEIHRNPFVRPALEMLVASPKKPLSSAMASPNSKVLMGLMMNAFPRKVVGTPSEGVSFSGGMPGMTLTDNVNQMGPVTNALAKLIAPVMFHSVEIGAAPLVWLATVAEPASTQGKVFDHHLRELPLPACARDAEGATAAWDATEAALGLV